jgi:DNA-directed RNA polymerase subunit RPC12/RpoP
MAGLQEYKCPACGGAIVFDSNTQKMKCPYCDTEFEIKNLKAFDEELKKELPDNMSWKTSPGEEWAEEEIEGMTVYGCKSCGGEIVVDETTAATACPFCDNPVVIMGRFKGTLRPNYIIPFKLDKKTAKEGLYNHLRGKKLLPKVFKDKNHIDKIKGIYLPFWLFDAEANANIRYKASKVSYYSDSKYNYTKTRYYSILRSGTVKFEKIPVDGSTKIDDDLMESIEPYDFKEAVDFQTAYLAGYLADKYNVDEKKSINRANERIRKSVKEEFRWTVKGYSTVVEQNINIQLKNGEAKYALYPVWLLNTTWNGNKYIFAMNGQTGKFVGDLPLDRGAYWKYFSIFNVIGAAIIFGLVKLII